jgi:hypothetical protein
MVHNTGTQRRLDFPKLSNGILSCQQDLYVARIPKGQKPADLLVQQSD